MRWRLFIAESEICRNEGGRRAMFHWVNGRFVTYDMSFWGVGDGILLCALQFFACGLGNWRRVSWV